MTAPGDEVSCRIRREKKKFVEAELLEVIKPSPARRLPPCPYFGDCGGCQWQHLSYEQQLHWKEHIFTAQLVRNGITSEKKILPVVPSEDEWHYRNRVQFKCHRTHDGMLMGFYRHGSHDVIDVDQCMLLSPPIQSVYGLLRNELPGCPLPEAVSQVDVSGGDDGAVRITLHLLPDAADMMRPWVESFAARYRVNACLQQGHEHVPEVVSGNSSLAIRIADPEMMLSYGPGGFAQVNSGQNSKMVAEMLDWLDLAGTETVLDLFCGMGNFSLPLATGAARVVGVEGFGPSIDSANQNAVDNGIHNAQFHVADAAAFARQFKLGEIDLVVLDPPRTGHYQASKEILSLEPSKILYISCDPATLARDLMPLVQNGYEVVSSRPFDLFPQTWHIESMTLLRKR